MDTELRSEPRGETGSQLADFVAFCSSRTGVHFDGPAGFHDFSVARFRDFWGLFLEWADPLREGDPEPVCTDDRCESATFFPNLRLSYAENLLRSRSAEDDERIAIVARHADGQAEALSRKELRRRVRALAGHLLSIGVESGDRVVAMANNDAETVIGGLAAATIGATFSSAAAEMGAAAILSRFEQLDPLVLMADLDAGRTGAAPTPAERVAEVAASLPTLKAVVALDDGPAPAGVEVPVLRQSDLLESPDGHLLADGWERFPFNHPLFILFTSGTTGPPKCIVHGAGGTLLEHLKELRLHVDLSDEDTLFFQTSAAWMMWNWQLSALACGAEIVLFDGPLSGPETLWEIVAEQEVSVFGTSPPYLQLCEDGGYSPRSEAPARRLRSILSTGSVLRDWQFDWVADHVGPVRLQSISGGTDIVGCFVLGHPELPVRRGMIQCRSLAMDVQALPTEETPAGSAVGELTCRNPFPSRPLGLLGDDGERFHEAYFARHEGVWTHGDLIEFDEDGQARILGRSDGVLNIQGVRIGPAEIYQALRAVPEIQEAMAVEQERGGHSHLVLLAVLRDGAGMDGELILRIRREIARQTTPLHVPELLVAVDELPVTHSGKRSERAGRDAVAGNVAANSRALANPESIAKIQDAVARAEAARTDREVAPFAEDASTIEKLRAIWEAVLGVEGVADDEDFFDVGGTSLLSVRLFMLIGDLLDTELPLSTLLEAPTISKLAALIDDPRHRADPLVLIRSGSEGPPLYFVHSIWGDVLGMRQMALAIQTDIPIYGLRARGVNPGEEPQRTVEEMARTQVDAIRAFQPQGPYRIAGHSFGGLVAFEIARQMTELGEEVAWLGILDAELSAACLPRGARWRYRLSRPFYVARAALAHPRGAARAVFRDALPNFFRRTVLRAVPNAPIDPPSESWMEEALPRHRYLARICIEAAADFRPQPYPGSMTYFVPEERRLHLFPDPLPVWRRVTEGELTLEPVAGPHVGMDSGVYGQFIARRIDSHFGWPR